MGGEGRRGEVGRRWGGEERFVGRRLGMCGVQVRWGGGVIRQGGGEVGGGGGGVGCGEKVGHEGRSSGEQVGWGGEVEGR